MQEQPSTLRSAISEYAALPFTAQYKINGASSMPSGITHAGEVTLQPEPAKPKNRHMVSKFCKILTEHNNFLAGKITRQQNDDDRDDVNYRCS